VPIVTVDEFGHGFVESPLGVFPLASHIGSDPGPGGLSSVLIYTLPFAGVRGDVFLTDADFGGFTLDVIRFNGDFTLIFYSDNIGGFDAPADTAGPPGTTYTTLVSIPELGPEGNNGAFYTPGSSDPGFGPLSPTFHFVSDGLAQPVPEPATLLLVGSGIAGLGRRMWRKRCSASLCSAG
jgi:PEP-CTERM motif